ncbi:MAG TPA: alpha,alpha-trehalase TreF [Woeseiaceae bacterium]|nr:alpha,alpha-trehalase TreF [Woeseiaceae bacterium]
MQPTFATLRSFSALCVLGLCGLIACATLPGDTATEVPAPPSVLFGDLFEEVALAGLFADSKQWADAVPKDEPAAILARYADEAPASREDLRAFVEREFVLDPPAPEARPPTPGLPLRRHIAALWPLLTRHTPQAEPFSSRLPLPNPYVVPGGRFREIYYWDSWFTMLGFGRQQALLQRGMVDNFAWLIEQHGHIPNGSRTYYLSRSQPPFFYEMVALLEPRNPRAAWASYLEELRAEHAFWMAGADAAAPGAPVRRVVVMPDGSRLNRYWDDRAAPRDESWREDVAVAREAGASGKEAERLWRDIRAAAESGWDFSSRWFADGQSLATIRTTDIVPPDLNSLLYGLERAISRGCETRGDQACADEYREYANARRRAIRNYLWNEDAGVFDDYHWREQRVLGHMTAATLYPLFAGVATEAQAERVADAVERHLLKRGGIVTSDRDTGQQWDAPNGWAPLQWIAVSGLRRYGETDLAGTVARRWLTTVSSVYAETGKLLEKYNVVELTPGGGGEYPLQDGFGWTNGVTVAMLRLYPDFELPRESDVPATAHP